MNTRGARRARFGQNGDGYLFLPQRPGQAPAVVVLHERYGLVQHTLDLARRLAEAGYVGLAPDLFSGWEGDRAALRRGDVRVELPDPQVADVIGEALGYLRRHERVDGDKLGLMGVCQSGRYPIVVASQRADLAACVVFYGAAQARDWDVSDLQPRPLEAMLRGLLAPCLFVFGEADHLISIEDVRRVREVLEVGRRSYRMKVFAEAPHGWLNDTMPGRYRPEAASAAWRLLLGFLGEVFAGKWPPAGRVRWEFESDIGEAYDFSKNVRLE
jgi:carboxymethylenebutenolidase